MKNFMMQKIWESQGQIININGERRTVESVRSTYGGHVVLLLSSPLPGRTSPSLTVHFDNDAEVQEVFEGLA